MTSPELEALADAVADARILGDTLVKARERVKELVRQRDDLLGALRAWAVLDEMPDTEARSTDAYFKALREFRAQAHAALEGAEEVEHG